MSIQSLNRLAAVIRRDRDVVLERWRSEVRKLPSAKDLDLPTLNDHVPALLDELAKAFEVLVEETIAEKLLEGSPPVHGLQRAQDGYDIVEVVAEYNVLRGCIYDLTRDSALDLDRRAFHILNLVFDEAIGMAVQTFATSRALEVQRRREEYLAFVAHDLRTPLNAVSLAARLLDTLFASNDNPHVGRTLRSLQRNVLQLKDLVDKVLKESAHVQAEAGVNLERRVLDLWPLVEDVIYELVPLARAAGTQLHNDVPEESSVYADADLLRRVFQNLVTNAIKHTPRGEVHIGAENSAGGGVDCWVSDNGIGIAHDRLDVIFDKLETDSRGDGTGLGLPIVKQFVEAHGGEVTVRSEEGNGATFRFTLPGVATD